MYEMRVEVVLRGKNEFELWNEANEFEFQAECGALACGHTAEVDCWVNRIEEEKE